MSRKPATARFYWRFLRSLPLLTFCLAAFCAWPVLPVSAADGERILLFDSRAEFQPDGVMLLTEKITVRADGKKIKRGLEREIPLRWNRSDNKRFLLSCEVLSVTRDGNPEPFTASTDKNKFFLRIGQADTTLRPGQYTYSITYRIQNNFSRFEEFDELYYNVTGNDWRLDIDEARFRLALPPVADKAALRRELEQPPARVRAPGAPRPAEPFYSIDVYTGFLDERGAKARILPDGSVRTTAPLRPGQGLTVAYTWPRGILAAAQAPQEYSRLKKALLPDVATLPQFAVPLLMLLFYWRAIHKRRSGASRPGVIPLFAPPDGLRPGQLRYALNGSYDQDSFAADVLRLVSLGAIRLHKEPGGPSGKRGGLTLTRAGSGPEAGQRGDKKIRLPRCCRSRTGRL